MIMILFIILFTLILYLSIHIHITCIIHDLGLLRVTQKIQVMGSLQSDKWFTINS